MSALYKVYVLYNDFRTCSLTGSITIVKPFLAHWLWLCICLLTRSRHLTNVSLTDQKKMLTPPKYLIPSPTCPGARVCPPIILTSNSYLCLGIDHSFVFNPLKFNADDHHHQIIVVKFLITVPHLTPDT
jgi:hypothetical protein